MVNKFCSRVTSLPGVAGPSQSPKNKYHSVLCWKMFACIHDQSHDKVQVDTVALLHVHNVGLLLAFAPLTRSHCICSRVNNQVDVFSCLQLQQETDMSSGTPHVIEKQNSNN